MRDTVAEMAAKAHEISLEAGSKMAAAMKDVVGAAAGLVAFSIESARDLVQYMVRRGQMTQDEADKLLRGVEEAWSKKHKGAKPPLKADAPKAAAKPVHAPAHKPTPHAAHKPAAKHAPAKKAAPKKAAPKKAAAKKAPAKKAAPKKAPAKKPAPKK